MGTRVKPGATVYVSDVASGEVEGRLLRLSPGSVTILVQGTEREFPKGQLRQISRRGDSLKNGALIGMAATALWGEIAGIRAEVVQTNDIEDPPATTAFVVFPVVLGMGAGVGALIDAANKGKTVVYRSAPRAITAHPIVRPGQLGVRVALRF